MYIDASLGYHWGILLRYLCMHLCEVATFLEGKSQNKNINVCKQQRKFSTHTHKNEFKEEQYNQLWKSFQSTI